MALVTTPLARQVIGCAIEVHRNLGPGLLESAYEECLCHELSDKSISFRRQLELPVMYKGQPIDCGFRADLVIDDALIVELKSVESFLPIHDAQVLTYLKLAGVPQALLINFNVLRLVDGLKSFLAKNPTTAVTGGPQ